MAKRVAREIYEFDTQAEFVAAGGAAGYGDGLVIVENSVMHSRDGFCSAGGIGGTRATPVRVATFGPSTANVIANHTAASAQPGSNDQDVSGYFSAPHPGSGSGIVYHSVMSGYALPFLYPQAWIVADCGIDGQTTTQLLARDNSAYSTTRRAAQDVIDLKPDVVLYRSAAINNLTSATAGTWESLANTAIAEHKEGLHRVLMSGALVIDEGVYGYSAANANGDYVRMAIVRFNQEVEAYHKANSFRSVFINWVGILSAADGNYLDTNISSDGVHTANTGGYLVGKQEARILELEFGKAASICYPGANLITNGLLTSVSSGLGAGWAVSQSNCSRQNLGVVVRDGKYFQSAEFVPSASTPLATFSMPFALSSYGIAANDKVGLEYDVFVEALNGAKLTNFNRFRNWATLAKTAAGSVVHAAAETNSANMSLSDALIAGKVRFNPIQLVEASPAYGTCTLNFTFQTTDSYSFRIGVGNPRMVKL